MARKKYEFRPDRTDSGILSKLYLTKKQRLSLVKWLLLAALVVLLSVVQDVVMSRVSILGSTTDLVSSCILLLCMILEPNQGCVFALIASLFYYFSGTSAGPQVIILLTGIGSVFSIFRRSYLRSSFPATILCAIVAIVVYELLIFALGVFLGSTIGSRFGIFLGCGLLSAAVMLPLYPVARAIAKIGGDAWKE